MQDPLGERIRAAAPLMREARQRGDLSEPQHAEFETCLIRCFHAAYPHAYDVARSLDFYVEIHSHFEEGTPLEWVVAFLSGKPT